MATQKREFKPDIIEVPTYEICEDELRFELMKRKDQYDEDFIAEFGKLDEDSELKCSKTGKKVFRSETTGEDICTCGFLMCPECRDVPLAGLHICNKCSEANNEKDLDQISTTAHAGDIPENNHLCAGYSNTVFLVHVRNNRLEIIKKSDFDAAKDKEPFIRPRIAFWKKRIAVYGDKTDSELGDVDRSDQHIINQIITSYKMKAAPYEMNAGRVFG